MSALMEKAKKIVEEMEMEKNSKKSKRKKGLTKKIISDLKLDIDHKYLSVSPDYHMILIRVPGEKTASLTFTDKDNLKDQLKTAAKIRDKLLSKKTQEKKEKTTLMQRAEKVVEQMEKERSSKDEIFGKELHDKFIKKYNIAISGDGLYLNPKEDYLKVVAYTEDFPLSLKIDLKKFPSKSPKAVFYYAAALRNYMQEHKKYPSEGVKKKYKTWALTQKKKLEKSRSKKQEIADDMKTENNLADAEGIVVKINTDEKSLRPRRQRQLELQKLMDMYNIQDDAQYLTLLLRGTTVETRRNSSIRLQVPVKNENNELVLISHNLNLKYFSYDKEWWIRTALNVREEILKKKRKLTKAEINNIAGITKESMARIKSEPLIQNEPSTKLEKESKLAIFMQDIKMAFGKLFGSN